MATLLPWVPALFVPLFTQLDSNEFLGSWRDRISRTTHASRLLAWVKEFLGRGKHLYNDGATTGKTRMRYEIEARASGEKVTIEYLDWLHLLNLAIRYDWGDMADLEHYLHDAAGVPTDEADEMAEALERASRDLQTEDLQETTPQPSGETALVNPGLRKVHTRGRSTTSLANVGG